MADPRPDVRAARERMTRQLRDSGMSREKAERKAEGMARRYINRNDK